MPTDVCPTPVALGVRSRGGGQLPGAVDVGAMIDADDKHYAFGFLDADHDAVVASPRTSVGLQFVAEGFTQPGGVASEWSGDELDDRGGDLAGQLVQSEPGCRPRPRYGRAQPPSLRRESELGAQIFATGRLTGSELTLGVGDSLPDPRLAQPVQGLVQRVQVVGRHQYRSRTAVSGDRDDLVG